MQDLGFWAKLAKPIIGLSPMDGVTDYPYRFIQKKYGQPDVIYTEFATVEGFCRGAERVLDDFLYDETQRPIVAQIYGTTPEFFRETAVAVCELGFDGIDLNMGCPAKNVAQNGAGAALIKTPQLAQTIFQATMTGIEDWQNGKTSAACAHIDPQISQVITKRHQQLPEKYQQHSRSIPISIKTRIGFDSQVVVDWIPTLLELKPAVIALHGRTLRQGYGGKADWEVIGQAVKLAKNSKIKILGNGDVDTRAEALEKVKQYGVDGVLIGRASFGNPWIFLDQEVDVNTRAKIAVEHSQLFEKTFRHKKNYRFLPMRKHLGWYIKGFANASEIRAQLMQVENSQEVKQVLKNHQLIS